MINNADGDVENANKDESRFLHQMLLLTFSSQKTKKASLDGFFKEMLEFSSEDMWNILGNRLDMLVEDLNVFTEQVSDLEMLEELYKKTLKEKQSLEDKRDKLSQSESDTVGFFTKVPKEDKLVEMEEEIELLLEKKNSLEGLINLMSENLASFGVDFLGRQKRHRFNNLMKEFARSQVDSINCSLDFWNCVLDDQKLTEEHDSEDGDEIIEQK